MGSVNSVWSGGHCGEPKLLRNCYVNSLTLAAAHNFKSIAFPLISSGIYGYPPRDALKVAVDAIKNFSGDLDVILTVLDKSLLDSATALSART